MGQNHLRKMEGKCHERVNEGEMTLILRPERKGAALLVLCLNTIYIHGRLDLSVSRLETDSISPKIWKD